MEVFASTVCRPELTLCYGFELKGENLEMFRKKPGDDYYRGCVGVISIEYFITKWFGLKTPFPESEYTDEKWYKNLKYRSKWVAWFNAKDALIRELGVTLVSHRFDGHQVYILAAEHVRLVNSDHMIDHSESIPDEWRAKLLAFCEKAGIQFEEPQFMLCCNLDAA